MPLWYGTFQIEHPYWNRFVVTEARDADEARAQFAARFGTGLVTVHDARFWAATNWAGHTHAQRQGLRELTAPEEESNHGTAGQTDPPT